MNAVTPILSGMALYLDIEADVKRAIMRADTRKTQHSRQPRRRKGVHKNPIPRCKPHFMPMAVLGCIECTSRLPKTMTGSGDQVRLYTSCSPGGRIVSERVVQSAQRLHGVEVAHRYRFRDIHLLEGQHPLHVLRE